APCACCLNAERGAQDHDCGLDVPLGARRFLKKGDGAREEISEYQAGEQRQDESCFPRQTQGPRYPERSELVGCRCDVGTVAQKPAEIAQPKDEAETERE